ncbi:uncharacterized protein LOC143470602 [Clavelina lepadiformis]|uniref:Uncharacterized protein n=1 Tax=Clavelina lepadiformis TaxID=159417 RepID=A0ABP0FSZ2_CLALP
MNEDANTTSMENTSSGGQDWDLEKVESQRLTSFIFSVSMAVVGSYLVIVTSRHAWLNTPCSSKNSSDRQENTSSIVVKGTKLVNILIWVVSCFYLLYIVMEIPLIYVQEEPYCVINHRITTISAIIILTCVYFALWFRVYSIFYRHPVIKRGSSRSVRIISKLTVIILGVMFVVNSVTFLTSPPYITEEVGCVKLPDPGHTVVKWGLLVTSTVVFQVTLLGLFVYPLIMHRRNTLHHGFDSKLVMPAIKRAFVTASICIVSDVLNSIYAIANNESLTYIRHTVYGCNLAINLIALICSNADWKQRLFPFVTGIKSQDSVAKKNERCGVRSVSQACPA